MGRTLHYKVLNTEEISEEEKEVMYEVSMKYNSGDYEDVWTCESFYLDPWAFHPNWEKVGDLGGKEFINRRYRELERSALFRGEILNKMHNEGLILFTKDTIYNGKVAGFTKVGGNEYNAFLVYEALIEISKNTKSEISLCDEGAFLYAPVLIRGGKAKIDVESVHRAWAFWEEKGWLKEEGGDPIIIEKKQMQESLIKFYPYWTEPRNLCRSIKENDFMSHPEYGASQIMAGFYGEYYGLSGDRDPEKESYRICSDIKKLVEKSGMTMEVAPKLSDLRMRKKKRKVK
ncbi:MAG: hypothetical protein AB1546_11325 [bacterium]